MGSFNVRADRVKNRLYVTFAGFFSDEEARAACTEVLQHAEKLGTGFDVITDITDFQTTTGAGAEVIRNTQVKLGERGVRRVVRVTGSQVLPNLQLTRTAREAGYGPGTKAETAATVDDAERLLEG